MYLNISGVDFLCLGFRDEHTNVCFYGVDSLALPVAGDISLYADDGFKLTSYQSTAYLRILYEGTTLILSNEPEPVPAPEVPPPPDPMDEVKLAIAELAETEAQRDLENKLAIAELAEKMLGGAV